MQICYFWKAFVTSSFICFYLTNTAISLCKTVPNILSFGSPSEETSKDSSLDNNMHQEPTCTDRIDQGSDTSSAIAPNMICTISSTENVLRYGYSKLHVWWFVVLPNFKALTRFFPRICIKSDGCGFLCEAFFNFLITMVENGKFQFSVIHTVVGDQKHVYGQCSFLIRVCCNCFDVRLGVCFYILNLVNDQKCFVSSLTFAYCFYSLFLFYFLNDMLQFFFFFRSTYIASFIYLKAMNFIHLTWSMTL